MEAETDESQGLSFLVPVDEPIMTVELRTVRAGETGETIQKVLYDVLRDPPPALHITGVESGQNVKPETSITLGALAEDNGRIVSIRLAVNGVDVSSVAGTPVLRGVRYAVPAGVASLLVEATASDSSGNTTTAIVSIRVDGSGGSKLEIISPAQGTLLVAGEDLNIDVKAVDKDGVVSVSGILTAGDAASRLEFTPISRALPAIDWRAVTTVPAGVTFVGVEVTATDNGGNTASESAGWDVQPPPDAPPSAKIISPPDGSTVSEGTPLKVEVEARDNGLITDVAINWPINHRTANAVFSGGRWVTATTVPTIFAAGVARPNEDVPPHVFVGPVTVGSDKAGSGTLVTAWIDGSSTSPITLVATVSDDSGNKSSTSIDMVLVGQQVQVGEATVDDGHYTLFVSAQQGQDITGKTIYFRVDGVRVSPTGSWDQGEGTEIPLRR